MSHSIIAPETLAPITTVPQCTDNQFVTRDVYSRIAGKTPLWNILEGMLAGRGHNEAADQDRASRLEYIRSLVYSRQVVINRAAFWNNPLLISAALGDDREGLVKLLSRATLVPFLYSEDSIDAPPRFEVLRRGREAVESLARDPGLAELACVRLGGQSREENQRQTGRMAREFRTQLSAPLDDDNPQAVFADIARTLLRDQADDETATKHLSAQLEDLARWVRESRPNRNDIYSRYITAGDDPSLGIYRTDPHVFELKQWIDLVYNANLPRFLGSLTFVPRHFPSPLDVGLTWTFGQPAESLPGTAEAALESIVERAGAEATWRAWEAVQENVDLAIPSPHDLDHRDVVSIRQLPEWTAMMDRMELHLSRPLDEVDLREFQQAYNDFLRALSAWWIKGRGAHSRAEFVAGVAKVYRVGRWMLGLLQIGHDVFPVLPPPGVTIADLPSVPIISLTVESALYVFQRGRVDLRRSQLVREMRKEQGIARDDLIRIERGIRAVHDRHMRSYLPGYEATELAKEEDV